MKRWQEDYARRTSTRKTSDLCSEVSLPMWHVISIEFRGDEARILESACFRHECVAHRGLRHLRRDEVSERILSKNTLMSRLKRGREGVDRPPPNDNARRQLYKVLDGRGWIQPGPRSEGTAEAPHDSTRS